MNLKKISSFDNGINNNAKEFVAKQLTLILSDQYLLFTQLNSFHWNVRGQNFGPLHLLFERGYKMLFEDFDVVAERILQLGYLCNASLENFLKNSRLKEENDLFISDKKMLEILIENFEKLIVQIRELAFQTENNFRDLATNNLMVDFLVEYEKYVWLLRSNLL